VSPPAPSAPEVLTGRENLVLVAQLRRLKDEGRIADDLLGRFALADAAGHKAATYSSGMRRRLELLEERGWTGWTDNRRTAPGAKGQVCR
jgi:ABC-type multidrug transport system ATPase subunit